MNAGIHVWGYRFTFQGQEPDDEIRGKGNSLNYKFRMHDPRIGRFFAVDPLAHQREWVSPYSFVQNNTINPIDPTGALDDEWNVKADGTKEWVSDKGGKDIDYYHYHDEKDWYYPDGSIGGTDNFYTHTEQVAISSNGLKMMGGHNKFSYYLGTEITVDRTDFTSQSTISNYQVNPPWGEQGYMLEPAENWFEAVEEGSDRAIRRDEYFLVPHERSNGAKTARLVAVDGRTVVLIHSGNFPSHTSACLLPNKNKGENKVVGGEGNRRATDIYNFANSKFGAKIIIDSNKPVHFY